MVIISVAMDWSERAVVGSPAIGIESSTELDWIGKGPGSDMIGRLAVVCSCSWFAAESEEFEVVSGATGLPRR